MNRSNSMPPENSSGNPPSPPAAPSSRTRTTEELAAELGVHQVELEMQKQELIETQAFLESSRRRYFCLFDLAPVPYFVFTREGALGEMNIAAGELLGASRAEAWQRPFSLHLTEESRPLFFDHLRQVFTGVLDPSVEIRLQHPDGRIRHVLARSTLLDAEDNKPSQVLSAFIDVTETREAERREKALQSQLNQTQRLESLGILAGGIAHDFNNLLQAILGFTELSLHESDIERARKSMGEIRAATLRGAQLTRQFLAFSRRQPLGVTSLHVPDFIHALMPTLQRLLRPNVQIRCQHEPHLPKVDADASQLEQVVMNLVMNACDAMPNGGTIEIQTQSMPQSLAPDASSGINRLRDAVGITIKDFGTGMSQDTAARIFEPFFSTKPRGAGSGLGLAVVHGVVKQHGGEVRVRTQLGTGTEMCVLLPVSSQRYEPVIHVRNAEFHGGGQLVLLAEDEPFLRSLSEGMLRRLGFQVVSVRDGAEAVERFRNHSGMPFTLFVFDILMPRKSGVEAYRELRDLGNCPPVLLISGYPGDPPVDSWLKDRSRILHKPFQEQEFAAEIELCLQLAVRAD